MKYLFKFPRCDAETVITEGNTYGEAADKAIAERVKHITPLTAQGEPHDDKKASLTRPAGAIING